jgi:hypothetical protein
MCIVPKFSLIDSWFWFYLFLNYLYLVALLILMVSYAFMFCSLMKGKLKTICMFFHMIWTHVWLSLFHFHDLLCCFSCYNMVAKFLLSRLYLSCRCFKFFDPSTQCLHIWSRLCRCISPQKLFLLLSLTYSRMSRS